MSVIHLGIFDSVYEAEQRPFNIRRSLSPTGQEENPTFYVDLDGAQLYIKESRLRELASNISKALAEAKAEKEQTQDGTSKNQPSIDGNPVLRDGEPGSSRDDLRGSDGDPEGPTPPDGSEESPLEEENLFLDGQPEPEFHLPDLPGPWPGCGGN